MGLKAWEIISGQIRYESSRGDDEDGVVLERTLTSHQMDCHRPSNTRYDGYLQMHLQFWFGPMSFVVREPDVVLRSATLDQPSTR